MLLWRFSSSGQTLFQRILLGRICRLFNAVFLRLILEDKDPLSGTGYLLWKELVNSISSFMIGYTVHLVLVKRVVLG